MDARYWKEFESMGDMDADKQSDSDGLSPRYSKDSKKGDMKARRNRSRTKSRSRSRSSSSSSSGSSTRSSSSSSRRHSDDRSYRSRKRGSHYHRNSPSRGTVRSSSYGSGREEGGSGWFPPAHPPSYPSQEVPPSSSSYIPPPYPQPPSAQGQYPPNYQGQSFGNNYHPGYPGYDSGPAPPSYYAPNFPHGSQPPHEYGLSGGPSNLGPGHPPSNWEMFPDTTLPPPNLMQGPVSAGDSIPSMGTADMKLDEAKKEAIEQELLQQKRTLAKQREDYVRRKFSLSRELNRLKDQKRELIKEKSKENERILRENAKLQNEIQQKLKSIDNVIEMLTNIIGDSAHLPEVIKEIKSMEKSSEKPKKTEKKKHAPGEERDERRSSDSGGKNNSPSPPQHYRDENRVYYDPGLHWCPDCNVFPKTVTHYLEHLHTPEHRQHSKLKFEDFPWHAGLNLHEKSPHFSKDSPPKRIPIRGVQFLIPASAWFCSMCKVWLGDNHCASKHIQSNQHSQNYSDFIMKNPHWEVDWLTERTRSYERNSEAKQQHSLQHQKHETALPAASASSSGPATIASLSDQLLAMLAANSKSQPQEPPPPPPPPPLTKSSSSSGEEDSPDRKSKKKKKKTKKRKRSRERKSPSKEKIVHPSDQIKLSYKSMPQRKVDPIPVDDNFISEWMPRVEKRDAVLLRKKTREENELKVLSKRQRKTSDGSREPSSEGEKKASPYEQLYNDHDEAVVFEKRPPYDKESSRSKKRIDDELKHDRHSRYDRENLREQMKIDERYKYKSDKYRYEKEERDFKHEDYKLKKDFKTHKDFNERERVKKSPMPRIKDSVEKKKLKAKSERNSDEDVHETSFEKRTSESALKKKDGKKTVINNLPKNKLPFIGRMPILKKKVEQKSEEKDDKKEPTDDDGMKDSTAEPATEPLATAEINAPIIESSLEELPKSTLIISKRPRLAEPGIVKKEILFNKPANDNLTEQDMDLDDDSAVPKEEEPAKDELHKDFKDALDLLFPEEKKKEEGEGTEIKVENEVKLEEQQQAAAAVAAAAAAGYMLPPGYDVGMYPSYYDQQAYVQQQWAQMGYDQAAQYPGAYAYPPPMDQAPIGVVVQQPSSSTTDIQPPEVKKKKNAPSQRMRRHLKKLKAKEAAQKGEGNKEDEEINEGDEDGVEDDEAIEDENAENGDEEDEMNTSAEPQKTSAMSISDLAMLGIDEDDAAAQGFF